MVSDVARARARASYDASINRAGVMPCTPPPPSHAMPVRENTATELMTSCVGDFATHSTMSLHLVVAGRVGSASTWRACVRHRQSRGRAMLAFLSRRTDCGLRENRVGSMVIEGCGVHWRHQDQRIKPKRRHDAVHIGYHCANNNASISKTSLSRLCAVTNCRDTRAVTHGNGDWSNNNAL